MTAKSATIPATLQPYVSASERSTSAVGLLNPSCELCWGNDAFFALSGLGNSALGKDIRAFRGGSETGPPEQIVSGHVQYMSTGPSVHSTCTPLFEAGRHVGYMLLESDARSSLHDIGVLETMRVAGEVEFDELFEHSADLVQIADHEGRLRRVNPAWLRRLGYRASEIDGTDVTTMFAPEYRDRIGQLLRGELSRDSSLVQAEMLTRHDRRVFVDGRVSFRVAGDRFVGTQAIFRDVTERQGLEQLKSDFVARVNHELRTPLTSISGALALLSEQPEGELPAKARGFIAIAERSAARLLALVNDILDSEAIAVGDLQTEMVECDARVVMVDEVERLRGAAARAFVTLDVSELEELEPLTLVSDPRRLHQIIGNFGINAIRHSEHDGIVLFRVRGGEGVARLSVADRGAGIPVEFRSSVFERFAQGGDARSGSGLGLMIAQGVAARLGGRVGFWSVCGEGTSFYLDLPADYDVAPATIDAGRFDEVADLVTALGAAPGASLRLAPQVGALSAEIILEELATCPDADALDVEVASARLRERFRGRFRTVRAPE